MRTTFFKIFFLFSFFSCDYKNERQKIIFELTNNDYKYWFRYHSDTSKPYALGFCINKNGTYIRYENPDYDISKRRLYLSPTLSKPIWKIINDSTIMFGEDQYYKILFLNQDSLVLQNLNANKEYLKLFVDKDQFTVPVLNP